MVRDTSRARGQHPDLCPGSSIVACQYIPYRTELQKLPHSKGMATKAGCPAFNTPSAAAEVSLREAESSEYGTWQISKFRGGAYPRVQQLDHC